VIKATVVFEQDIVIKDYTAKLVKTLLISGNPKLEELLSKGRDFPPKPIHITPLYTTVTTGDGRERKEVVYTRFVPKESTARPPHIEKLRPVRIEAGKKYFFYVGTSMNLLNEILTGLSNASEFNFGRDVVSIGELGYEISYVDVNREAERATSFLVGEGPQIKVVFESPTILKDPLAIMRWKKKKLLLPLPEAVLSIPVFMVLYDSGKVRTSIILKCMRYIKSSLDIPYTTLKTVRLVWYVYDNKVLPAMIGYAKYFVDGDILQRVQTSLKTKYSLSFAEILSKALVLAQVYGVGDGRATGFGHASFSVNRLPLRIN